MGREWIAYFHGFGRSFASTCLFNVGDHTVEAIFQCLVNFSLTDTSTWWGSLKLH